MPYNLLQGLNQPVEPVYEVYKLHLQEVQEVIMVLREVKNFLCPLSKNNLKEKGVLLTSCTSCKFSNAMV